MQELRFVAVSEDGSYAVLAVPGRSGRYILPIDERLRAVAQGQTSRLAQYEIEVESPLRPKEIQARIRAGETAEEIADAAGIPVERVRWFEGPVLAERAYIADQAQSGSVRRAGDSSGPGPRLGDIVTARLSAAGTDPAEGQWDSRKRGDGNWQVSLTFPSGGRLHVAEWVFDPRRRHVMPDDDNAARLSLPESELPAEPVPMPGEATVTPIASRLGAAAGMGGGAVGFSRFRPDRSVIPDRSLGADRSLADRPLPPPVSAPERTTPSDRPAMSDPSAMSDRTAAPERPAMPHSPVPPRPAQQDRPGYPNRPANPGYAEFPESAPYRAPEPAPEPPGHHAPATEQPTFRGEDSGHRGYGDPSSVSLAYRAHVAEPPAYREAAPEPRTYAPEPAAYRAPAPSQPAFRDDDPVPGARRAYEPDQGFPGSHAPAAQSPSFPDAATTVEPAAPVSAAADFDDPERPWLTAPRPVIFEDPEPAFLGEQLEEAPASAPARPAPAVPSAPERAPVSEPAAISPAFAPEPLSAPAVASAAATSTRAVTAPAPASPVREVPAAPAEQVPAATVAAPAASTTPEPAVPTTELPAGTASTPLAAITPAPGNPAEATATPAPTLSSQPETREPEPVAAQPEPALAEAPATAKPEVASTATSAEPAPVAAAEFAPVAEPTPVAVADTQPIATTEQVPPSAETATPAEPTPTEEQSPRPRPGTKKNAKARRSSVPSWDEIMLGSSRQRD